MDLSVRRMTGSPYSPPRGKSSRWRFALFRVLLMPRMTPSARPFPLFLFPLLAGCALLLASCGKTEDPAPPKVAVKGMEVFVAKAPVAGVDASEARTALVIGVGDYKDTYFQSLEAPAGDARKIAEKLRVLGFEVTLKLNPARGEMLTLTDDSGLRSRDARAWGSSISPATAA